MKRILPLFMILSLVAILVLSGCGGSTPQPPSQTSQPMCSLRVISSCFDCYGNVYLNGFPTGEYLITNGAVTIQNVPCGQGVAVYLVDEAGWVSHTEYVTVTGPNTIVNFREFF